MTTDTTPTTAAAADEPSELTPIQYALLDAFKDVALSAEAPGAKYATEELARLTAAAFGYPLPEPVLREGGVAGYIFGNPIPPQRSPAATAELIAASRKRRLAGGPVDPKRLVLVGEREGEQLDYGTHADPPALADAVEPDVADPWPFKPGDVIVDAEGAITEQLDDAPVGTIVTDDIDPTIPWEYEGRSSWVGAYRTTSDALASHGTLTVVTVGPRP